VQVAASDRPHKTTTRQMLGHFRKAEVPPKRIVKEFPVTPDAHVPVGEARPKFNGKFHTEWLMFKVQRCPQFILFLGSSLMSLPIRTPFVLSTHSMSDVIFVALEKVSKVV
jgi:hypothetical protein